MTKIKICGLFRGADVNAVNEVKPDYAGFVFAESRRQVTAIQARALRDRLDPAIVPVGVFVNAAIGQITALFDEGIISVAQLHGQEDESYIQRLKQQRSLPVIKAVRVNGTADILDQQSSAADFLLLDNGAGGTGQVFDWALIPDMVKPYFLAGGIDELNLESALALFPYGIDISSGAESDGFKDPVKIQRLVSRVRKHESNVAASMERFNGRRKYHV